MSPPQISVIVPIYNEEDNIDSLCERTFAALNKFGRPFELIVVDDGSTDASFAKLKAIAATDERIKIVSFRRNRGQTAAMAAGFDFASGDILVPMDGDLQNDPDDIRRLVEKLEEGWDVVSGWRKLRHDSAVKRVLLSRIANAAISRISGVHLHDYGCTLKAYRRDVLKDVRLYGEMHRFIPIYASWHGSRVTELQVTHHPRRAGQSKYGLERIFKVILDLLMVQFLARYETKPLYVFGFMGVGMLVAAVAAGLWAIWLKVFNGTSFIQTPLPLLVMMLFVSSVICILMGLLAEVLMRVYFEAQGKPIYHVAQTVNLSLPQKSKRQAT